jgi:hypothetical protein
MGPRNLAYRHRLKARVFSVHPQYSMKAQLRTFGTLRPRWRGCYSNKVKPLSSLWYLALRQIRGHEKRMVHCLILNRFRGLVPTCGLF